MPIKLARPDLFHPKIVLAGCPKLIEGDGDDAGLVSALAARGLNARWLSWDDPATLTADLVILRATWDYIERLDEFLAWSTKVRNLLNSPAVVAWNTDKHYLHDLAVAGVPVVESEFFEPGQDVHLPAGEVVVKPAIGMGSIGAQRFTDNAKAREHAAVAIRPAMHHIGVLVAHSRDERSQARLQRNPPLAIARDRFQRLQPLARRTAVLLEELRLARDAVLGRLDLLPQVLEREDRIAARAR